LEGRGRVQMRGGPIPRKAMAKQEGPCCSHRSIVMSHGRQRSQIGPEESRSGRTNCMASRRRWALDHGYHFSRFRFWAGTNGQQGK
jgi:hypothetical protein